MAQLTLVFFNTFHAALDSQPVTRFRSSNNQGLLVYLSMQSGQSFPREVLATLFWPEETEDNARNNLRQALYQLRKVLGDLESPDEPYFLATRQAVQFNPDSDFTLDVSLFLTAVERGDLETAAEHYHGDLLPGFTCDSLQFEEWLRLQREQLHRLALEAMFEVSREHLQAGRLKEAQAVARKQLNLEPWREQAHRQLMEAYSLAGDRGNALAQYELCRQRVWQELGLEPARETTALYENIKAGRYGPVASDEPLQPPVKARHNLPADTTPFIGRELELSELSKALNTHDRRLLTIIGPGGMGKTRLAVAVGRQLLDQFPDGVYFVDLAPLSQPEEIMPAVAATLGFQAPDNTEALQPQLLAMLRRRHLLLILDNYDHLLAGATLVGAILQTCHHVSILVTSRERLNLTSESRYELGGLDFPDSLTVDEASSYTAIRLFVDSGRRAQYKFTLTDENLPAVIGICQRVQGLPLALVLAAAWLELLSPAEIAGEIEASLNFLAADLADLPPRQQSMEAVFERSWAMLTPDEQQVMAGLSVFRGSFSREAAEEVVGANLRILLSLVNKSLLQRGSDTGRFNLHELLRQFAAGKRREIDSAEKVAMAHCRYFARLMEKENRSQVYYFPVHVTRQYAADRDNVRRAWEYALQRGLANELSSLVRGVTAFSFAQGIQAAPVPRRAVRSLRERGILDTDPAMLHLRLTVFASLVGIEDPAQVRQSFLEFVPILQQMGELELLFWTYERLAFMSLDSRSSEPEIIEWSDKIYSTALQMGDQHLTKLAEVHNLWSRDFSGRDIERDRVEELLSFFEPDFSNSLIYFTLQFLLGTYYSANGEYEKAIHYRKRNQNIAKGWQDLFWIGGSCAELAAVYLTMGLQSQADRALLEAIDWHLAIGQVWQTLGMLWGTAVGYSQSLGAGLAVQILSMAYHHPELIAYHKWRIEGARSQFEKEMGVDAFAAAWEKGKSLDFDTAVAQLRMVLAGDQ